MVHPETVEELAESIADSIGIYGTGYGSFNETHTENCKCRICFVELMIERIYRVFKNDIFLKKSIKKGVKNER